MRNSGIATFVSLFTMLMILMLFPACGGDDSLTPAPEPEPEPTQEISANLTLPAGCTAPLDSLVVQNGLGQASVGADGRFTLTVRRGENHMAWVRGPEGNPLLAGWISEQSKTLDCRSTAEALVFFGTGIWTLPGDGQVQAQALLTALTTELDPLEAALAAELVAHPEGFSTFSQTCSEALDAAVVALMGLPGKGLLIEPSAGSSGVEVLNQGGLNSVTVKNNWRRRLHVVIDRMGYVQDGIEHASVLPVTDFEVPPIAGYAGFIGTLSSYFSGATAYLPVIHPPVQLENLAGADYTIYHVKSLGIGAGAGIEADLTAEELQMERWVAAKCVVMDFFIPLFLNIIADQAAAAELEGTLRNPALVPAVTDFVNTMINT
nr:hypothetical protein [Candidatus Krumholzibacteria bacterium]